MDLESPEDTLVETRLAEAGAIEELEFSEAFGEPLARALDLETWHAGGNLQELYGRLEREIEAAVRQENRLRETIRRLVFPRIRARDGAPPGAGVYQANISEIEKVHRLVLFPGKVEACDGTTVVHDTLPITIAQIGVSLVSYQGNQGAWVHRLFRRDLRVGSADPVEETLEVLERRQRRSGFDRASKRDTLSELARRGIMTYAERAVLLRKSAAPWRMGHGNPAPYELLTGSGMVKLLEASLDLLTELVLNHRRFVFVPSAPAQRAFLTIANALMPLEYAIVDTLEQWVDRLVERGHYTGDWASLRPRIKEFAGEVARKIVVGLYRASAMAPAGMFYAHVDHAHEAAHIALADGTLQEHRGFPMLIDLADAVCRATFDPGAFSRLTEAAYAHAGEPFRYLTERHTR